MNSVFIRPEFFPRSEQYAASRAVEPKRRVRLKLDPKHASGRSTNSSMRADGAANITYEIERVSFHFDMSQKWSDRSSLWLNSRIRIYLAH